MDWWTNNQGWLQHSQFTSNCLRHDGMNNSQSLKLNAKTILAMAFKFIYKNSTMFSDIKLNIPVIGSSSQLQRFDKTGDFSTHFWQSSMTVGLLWIFNKISCMVGNKDTKAIWLMTNGSFRIMQNFFHTNLEIIFFQKRFRKCTNANANKGIYAIGAWQANFS